MKRVVEVINQKANKILNYMSIIDFSQIVDFSDPPGMLEDQV